MYIHTYIHIYVILPLVLDISMNFFIRRHHCRSCGAVVCGKCSDNKVPLKYKDFEPDRVCMDCCEHFQKSEFNFFHQGCSQKEQKMSILTLTHFMFAMDQSGGLRSPPGPQGTPPTPILEKTLVSRNDFQGIRNKKKQKVIIEIG